MSFGPPDIARKAPPAAGKGSKAPEPANVGTAAVYGAKARTRSAIAKGSAAKGANGERDVLAAFRAAMQAVEAALVVDGHTIVPRSDFAARKRIEAGTSNRDLGNIPIVAIEVKRNEKLSVAKMWEQAVRQADKGELPVLVYRRNREPWRVYTWVALTSPSGQLIKYATGEVLLVDFLDYYATIYKRYLVEGLS